MTVRAPDTVARLTMDASQHHKAMVQAGRDLAKLERETKMAAKAQDHLKQTTLKLSKGTGEMSTQAASASMSMRKLAIGVGAAVVAFKGLDKVLGDGLRAEGIYRALPYSIDETAEALDGMVTKLQLATSASQANALKLNLSKDEFTQLSKAAAVAGQTMGIDMKTAMDSLIAGIGRQSRMMLDNIGVIVSAEASQRAYAKELGKTVKELTEAEKKAAFTKEVIRQLNETSESGKLVTRGLGAQWRRFTNAISNATTATKRFVSTWTSEWSKAYEAEERRLAAIERRTGKIAIRRFNAGMSDMQRRGDALDAERKLKSGKDMLDTLRAGGKERKSGRKAFADDRGTYNSPMAAGLGAMSSVSDAQMDHELGLDGGVTKQDEQLKAYDLIKSQSQIAMEAKIIADQRMIESNNAVNDSFKSLASDGLMGFTSGIAGAIDAAVSGQASFGQAMQAMLNSTLRSVAKQATVKALFEAGEALASLAVLNFPAAALHGAAALKFGAIAAVGFGASAAIGSPSSAGAGSATSRPSTRSGGTIPRSGSSSSGKPSNQPIVINVRFDRSDPHSLRMAQAKMRAEMAAA